MIKSFAKMISHCASVFLTMGLVGWLEMLFTVEWSSPYCTSQADGPASAAFGIPLPYLQWNGTSSLEYDFMPHTYLFNLWFLGVLLFPAIHRVINRFSTTSQTIRRFAFSMVGLGLMGLTLALHLVLISDNTLIPTFSIGDEWEPYFDFRPVGFSLKDGHYACKPSRYWFPKGWQHD